MRFAGSLAATILIGWAHAAPAAVELKVTKQLPDTIVLEWTGDAPPYEVLRGSARDGSDLVVLEPSWNGTTWTDPGALTAPGSFYYQVRAAGPAAPTLTQVQAAILSPSCAEGAGCHTGAAPRQGLDLSSGLTWSRTVNVASTQQPTVLLVAPGDPDASYLVRKIEGTAGITGGQMPRGGPFLSAQEIADIRAWIQAGAQDN